MSILWSPRNESWLEDEQWRDTGELGGSFGKTLELLPVAYSADALSILDKWALATKSHGSVFQSNALIRLSLQEVQFPLPNEGKTQFSTAVFLG
jgi:hypothetical protein